MTTTDIVNLALNIGLGVVSLILSIFAIWLSLRFNDSSNSALDAIKELAREIKTVVEIGLSQQNQFSTKMLDSIIEQSRFGRPELTTAQSKSELENVILKSLENAEQNITLSVEKKVRELIATGISDPHTIEAGINEIRTNIQEFSGLIKDQSTVVEALRSYREFPAYYVLLSAIIKSGAHSKKELKRVESEYSIPRGWESAIPRLIENGLLQGTANGFRISKENQKILTDWVNANWEVITRLMECYTNDGETAASPIRAQKPKGKDLEIVKELNF